jgi:hypothetical protein
MRINTFHIGTLKQIFRSRYIWIVNLERLRDKHIIKGDVTFSHYLRELFPLSPYIFHPHMGLRGTCIGY